MIAKYWSQEGLPANRPPQEADEAERKQDGKQDHGDTRLSESFGFHPHDGSLAQGWWAAMVRLNHSQNGHESGKANAGENDSGCGRGRLATQTHRRGVTGVSSPEGRDKVQLMRLGGRVELPVHPNPVEQ